MCCYDRSIDNSSMQRKGIRLSVPGLYKSAFSDLKRKAPTINFDVSWSQNEKNYQYAVNLNVPNESDSARRDMWRYHSEKLTVNNQTVWGRSGASKTTYDPYVGLLMLEPNEELAEVRTEIEKFKNYAIYQPNTQALRERSRIHIRSTLSAYAVVGLRKQLKKL